MLFKGNSSRLELLIEKIQANKENHNVTEQDIKDALGTDPGSSWRSETPEDQTSPSPSSCATPNSATDVPDSELTYTVGVTEGTPYACQFCDKAFPRLSYLKKHEQTHSDQMPFRCEFCSRLFKHKRSRDRHVKLHTGDKKYRCSHCEAAFSRSDHLKIHMKTHDNQKPFQCTVCNRGYNTAAALTSHMQNHKKEQNGHTASNSSRASSSNNTPSPGVSSFRCLQCGDTFRKPEDLQGHMLTQHNVDTTSPPVSLSRGLLGGLMLGESPLARSPSRPLSFPTPKLACIYCTKDSFTTMEALQLHVQAMHGSILNGELREYSSVAHPPLRPSPSPSLPPHHLLTSPTTASASSTHSSTPSLMPYACELCTMRFGSVQGLQKHAITVHGLLSSTNALSLTGKDHHGEIPGAPLYCIQCSMTFPSASMFAEHYVLVHGSAGGLISSSPAPEQVRPTDLSKKSHRHHDERSTPVKKQKMSPETTLSLRPGISETPNSSLANHYDLPGTLLCNQCGAALPDFESFRSHLKSHLEESSSLRGLLGGGADVLSLLAQEQRNNSAKSPLSLGALSCPHCGAKFSTSDDPQTFEQHVASHFMATVTEYGCQSCLKLFSKPDELQKHLMDIHAHHLYRCSLCKEMFDSKVAIQVHFAVKHSNECKLYRCTACTTSTAVFRSEQDFGLHIRTIHPPIPILSNNCTTKISSQQAYPCLFCRLSFSTELEMQFHLAVHSKQFHCPVCQEAFHVEFLLDKHMQTHHSSQVLKNNTSNCPENLTHQQKSPKSKSTPINLVPNSNSNSISSGSSNNSHNNSDNNNVIKKSEQTNNNSCCDICDRCDFVSESELLAHRKLAHHIKPQTGKNGAVSLHCAYCSENCKSRTELENHMKTHSQGSGGSGKHKCNICDELCPSAAVLAEHKLTHCKVITGSTCTQCKATLVNEEQFYSHLQQHSSNNNNTNSTGAMTVGNSQQVILPTPCVVCRQTLISDIEVRMHARFHLKNSTTSSSEPTYQCCLCLKHFDLSNVIIANGSNGIIPSIQSPTCICKDCYHHHSKASPSQHQQLLQLQQQHEQVYRCSECQLKFESSSVLEAHLVTVHRKTYQCIKCQVSFETEREIQQHVATHLLTEGSSHECHLCRRMLATPLKLQAHLIEHTFAGCGSYTCYLCSAVFTAAQGLQQHMLEHGLSARPYDCTRCSLRFFFRAELDNHSYMHLEEDAAAMSNSSHIDGSDLANKMAYYHHLTSNGSYDSTPEMHFYKTLNQEVNKNLKNKNKNFSKSSLFKCVECSKEFSTASGLQAHQRHHKHSQSVNNGKKHTCSDCGKDFTSARSLSLHMQLHKEERNSDSRRSDESTDADKYGLEITKAENCFSCPICRNSFADMEILERHISSQHYRCSLCNEIFTLENHLANHMTICHSDRIDKTSNNDNTSASDFSIANMKKEPFEIKKEQSSSEDNCASSPLYSNDDEYNELIVHDSADISNKSSSSDSMKNELIKTSCDKDSNANSLNGPICSTETASEELAHCER